MIEAFAQAAALAAVPLVLAALGELLTEKSGLVNIGIEGILLSGALGAAVVSLRTGDPYLGLAAAGILGAGLGLLFGVFCAVKAADPIVVGLSLNLLALGGTGAAYRWIFGRTGAALTLPTLSLGVFLGLTILATLAIHGLIHRTRWGLAVVAAGEKPAAAKAAGISVVWVRVVCAAAGGFLAGLGGASLSLCLSNTFIEGMSSGRGFVALAIVILGRSEALGVGAASLLFGGAWALQFRLQAAQVTEAYQFLLMAPYLATLLFLVLAGLRTKSGGAR